MKAFGLNFYYLFLLLYTYVYLSLISSHKNTHRTNMISLIFTFLVSIYKKNTNTQVMSAYSCKSVNQKSDFYHFICVQPTQQNTRTFVQRHVHNGMLSQLPFMLYIVSNTFCVRSALCYISRNAILLRECEKGNKIYQFPYFSSRHSLSRNVYLARYIRVIYR